MKMCTVCKFSAHILGLDDEGVCHLCFILRCYLLLKVDSIKLWHINAPSFFEWLANQKLCYIAVMLESIIFLYIVSFKTVILL